MTIGLFQFLNWLDGAIWGGQQLPNTGVGSKQRAAGFDQMGAVVKAAVSQQRAHFRKAVRQSGGFKMRQPELL